MKYFLNTALGLALANALSTTTLATATTLPAGFSIKKGDADLSGYNITDMHFTGEINGFKVDHYGTIQDVIGQLDQQYPDFHPEEAINITVSNSDLEKHAHNVTVSKSSLEQRDRPGFLSRICHNRDWPEAYAPRIQEGIGYLRNSHLICNTGPRSCNRVSCSYNAAIFVCNDNNDVIFPTCDMISMFAQDIDDGCYRPAALWMGYVAGQEFSFWNWNIVIKYDRC